MLAALVLSDQYTLLTLLSALCFTLSQSFCLFTPMRHSVHHSIDTIYLALCSTLIGPSFILCDFSLKPAAYTVEPHEVVYYMIGGVITWGFAAQFNQLLY